jgi:hypothetical protein
VPCRAVLWLMIDVTSNMAAFEFLINQTTCALSKRTISEIFCQKDHLAVAAPLARRHVARAAGASAGRPVPPMPTPACGVPRDAATGSGPCRLPHSRQGDVAPCRLTRRRHLATDSRPPAGTDSHAN